MSKRTPKIHFAHEANNPGGFALCGAQPTTRTVSKRKDFNELKKDERCGQCGIRLNGLDERRPEAARG